MKKDVLKEILNQRCNNFFLHESLYIIKNNEEYKELEVESQELLSEIISSVPGEVIDKIKTYLDKSNIMNSIECNEIYEQGFKDGAKLILDLLR